MKYHKKFFKEVSNVRNPESAAKVFQSIIKAEAEEDRCKEHFFSMGLNMKNRILYVELVSLGTLGTAPIHPRELLKLAILKSAYALIVCHNHPSGNVDPSSEDIKVTSALSKATKTMDIPLLDHIIITEKEHRSLKNMNRIF